MFWNITVLRYHPCISLRLKINTVSRKEKTTILVRARAKNLFVHPKRKKQLPMLLNTLI